MAKARMLSKTVSLSRQLASLKSDAHRLLFTWLIPHTDVAGRLSGDSAWIRAAVVPLLDHMTTKKVEVALADLERVGLVQRYKDARGDEVVVLLGFHKHQPGLRADREAPSSFGDPANDGARQTEPNSAESLDSCVTNSGVTPADSGATPASISDLLRTNSGVTPTEGKGKEEKGRDTPLEPSPAPPTPPRPKDAKGTRCPPGSSTPDEVEAWLLRWDIPRLSDPTWGKQVQKFLDTKRSAPGDKGIHREWDAAWRTWTTKAVEWGHVVAGYPVTRSALATPQLPFSASSQGAEIDEMRRRAAAEIMGVAS
jgi:hypothetical protein